MPSPASSLQTRDKILEAAHHVFAMKGFRAATVFDIVSAAGTNQASINYHFGSKERLYHEVLRYSFRRMNDMENVQQKGLDGPPREKLRAVIRSMLGAMALDAGWHRASHRLLMWETLMPSGGLDELLDKEMLPHLKMVAAIVREILGEDAAEERVSIASMWLVGACGFFTQTKPVVDAHFPKGELQTPAELDRLADYLSGLCLNGLVSAGQCPAAWPAVPAG